MLSKADATKREIDKMIKAIQAVEAYIDGKLELGERQFDTASLFGKTNLPSNYMASFVETIKKHYRTGSWEVRRDYGDQRDPYDVLVFT